MSKLTKLEQETIILFNEQEGTAEIYTHSVKLQNRFGAFVDKHPDLGSRKDITFTVPKKLLRISIVSPPSEAQMAQSKALGAKGKERFQKANKVGDFIENTTQEG